MATILQNHKNNHLNLFITFLRSWEEILCSPFECYEKSKPKQSNSKTFIHLFIHQSFHLWFQLMRRNLYIISTWNELRKKFAKNYADPNEHIRKNLELFFEFYRISSHDYFEWLVCEKYNNNFKYIKMPMKEVCRFS